jgi:hypothetical protein
MRLSDLVISDKSLISEVSLILVYDFWQRFREIGFNYVSEANPDIIAGMGDKTNFSSMDKKLLA